MLRAVLFCSFALLLLVGCDAQEERPITLAERVAGTWELVGVRDSATPVTDRFLEDVGAVRLQLGSVGCCARSARYQFTVTRPSGEQIVTTSFYSANDNPDDGDDFIYLLSNDAPIALQLAYDFDPSFKEMTLTALSSPAEIRESLRALGVDFHFREEAIFVFDKVE